MAKLLINGKVNYQAPEALTLNLQSTETYVLKEIILSSNREESAAVIEEQVKPNDVYEIVTSDGVTWIVSGDELLSNYSQPSSAKRGNSWMETSTFDLSSYQNGIYFVNLFVNNSLVKTEKVILSK